MIRSLCILGFAAVMGGPFARATASVTSQASMPADAGTANLQRLLRENSYPIALVSGRLEGTGAEWLAARFGGVQFVLLGERHGIREVPVLAGALLSELHGRHGFDHTAVENGPIAMEVGGNYPSSRQSNPYVAFARQYPNALAFSGDQDLSFYDRARQMLQGGSDSVWGLDQEFGSAHALTHMRRHSTDQTGRAALDALLALITPAEQLRFNRGGRHWMALDSRPQMFTDLRGALRPKMDSVPDEWLMQLETSARIYENNRLAGQGQVTGFLSNDEREQLMKRNFMQRYRRVSSLGHKPPRVFIKMGQAHMGRGQSPFGPFTLGNLLSEFATSNGLTSLHLLALAHNSRSETDAPSLWQWEAMRPLAEVTPPETWTLIDLRPLRAHAHSGRLGTILPDLRRTIFAFDAVILLGGARDQTDGLTTP